MCLIRMGVMRGKGKVLFQSARFEKDYGPLNHVDLGIFYHKLIKLLSTLPNGPFNALEMLLGRDGACQVAADGAECDIPDNVVNLRTQPSGSSSRRSAPSGSQSHLLQYFATGNFLHDSQPSGSSLHDAQPSGSPSHPPQSLLHYSQPQASSSQQEGLHRARKRQKGNDRGEVVVIDSSSEDER